MNSWILVARESNESDLSFFAGFKGSLDSALVEDPIGVIVIHHFMELPKIEVVSLQAAKTLLQIAL